jgi:hypothetical protein
VVLGIWSFSAYVAESRAADPNAFICGNPGIASIGLGFVVGGLVGAVFGKILSHLVPPSKPDV